MTSQARSSSSGSWSIALRALRGIRLRSAPPSSALRASLGPCGPAPPSCRALRTWRRLERGTARIRAQAGTRCTVPVPEVALSRSASGAGTARIKTGTRPESGHATRTSDPSHRSGPLKVSPSSMTGLQVGFRWSRSGRGRTRMRPGLSRVLSRSDDGRLPVASWSHRDLRQTSKSPGRSAVDASCGRWPFPGRRWAGAGHYETSERPLRDQDPPCSFHSGHRVVVESSDVNG